MLITRVEKIDSGVVEKQVVSKKRVADHGEVFTGKREVNAMLDLVKRETERIESRFLEPACGAGNFVTEILELKLRIVKSRYGKSQLDYERSAVLAVSSIYGIDILEDNIVECRKRLFQIFDHRYSSLFKKRTKKECLDAVQFILEKNIIHGDALTLKTVGNNPQPIVFSEWSPVNGSMFKFIHTEKPEELFNMKFDVIVGNPPYQLDTGGSGRQAKPIYQHFVHQAKKLSPRYLIMIIPSRWFAGGMGLNEFREEMINDDRINTIVDYLDARECFPGVDIAGGICYFLWERDNHGDCTVVNRFSDKEFISKRRLNEFKTFIRFGQAVPILKKVLSRKEESLTKIISSTRPFGLQTGDRPTGSGDIHLVSSGGEGLIPSSKVTTGKDMVNKWKVMTSKTSHDHAGQPDKDGTRRVLSRVEILKPNYVCTESYIILGAFSQEQMAQNCLQYVKTNFVRFLISLLSFSQDITRERFAYVPLVNMEELWTDEKLYKRYGLTQDDIAFIESMIRPIEIGNG